MLIGALVTRTAMRAAHVLLALVLRDLCFLLDLRQRIEGVSCETDALGYTEVALVLGEKRSSFGSEPGARLIQ